MKTISLLSFLSLLGLFASCQTRPILDNNVVCETYTHRYGVPLEPKEWSARGEDGQVTSVLKDGVAVTRSYQGGVLHGESFYTFPYRDVIQKREIYDQGKLILECLHDSSGFPLEQKESRAAEQYCLTKWYESGAPKCREEYQGEILQEGEYYDANHQPESRVENGEGERVDRDQQGQLKGKERIQGGKKVRRVDYHPNGTPAAINPYIDQKIQGERCTFSPNGEPMTIEQWHQDSQHGNTVLFEYGEKRADIPYVHGKKHGVERLYRGEGVAQEVNWVQGQKHGPVYIYGDSPKIDWYFKDEFVPNKATYDALSNQ